MYLLPYKFREPWCILYMSIIDSLPARIDLCSMGLTKMQLHIIPTNPIIVSQG